jgi:hypothetical protein
MSIISSFCFIPELLQLITAVNRLEFGLVPSFWKFRSKSTSRASPRQEIPSIKFVQSDSQPKSGPPRIWLPSRGAVLSSFLLCERRAAPSGNPLKREVRENHRRAKTISLCVESAGGRSLTLTVNCRRSTFNVARREDLNIIIGTMLLYPLMYRL